MVSKKYYFYKYTPTIHPNYSLPVTINNENLIIQTQTLGTKIRGLQWYSKIINKQCIVF